MTHLKPLLLMLAASLVSSSCMATPAPAFPAPGQGELASASPAHGIFVALSAEENDALRHALDQSSIVVVSRIPRADVEAEQRYELRGAEAVALLAPLRRVPQWYRKIPVRGRRGAASAFFIRVDFRDADGNKFGAFRRLGSDLYYADAEGHPVSLHDLAAFCIPAPSSCP